MSFFCLLILLMFFVLDLFMIIMGSVFLLFIMFGLFFFILSLLLSVVCLVIFFFFSYKLFFFFECLIKLLSLCHMCLMMLFLSGRLCDWTKIFVCIGAFINLLIYWFFVWTNFWTIWGRFYTSDLSSSLNFSDISSIFINLSYKSTSLSNGSEVWPNFA